MIRRSENPNRESLLCQLFRNNLKSLLSLMLLLIILASSCTGEEKQIEVQAEDYHNAVDRITEVMVHDIFSPPVASCIYAYTNIAAHEILTQNNKVSQSFAKEYKNFPSIPKVDAEKAINYRLAALIAHLEIGKQLVFSENRIQVYQDSLYNIWEKQNATSFKYSKEYGLEVANVFQNG